ncbi:hypothetical protein Lalb_Chr07g0185141 [Lupinus albus]|uniref:VQ domain-containing protein n=1 Tax=Lupinus albus TaxID=3870 RepID=A0A6A4Q8Q8_LUPAL|nr:hypothetical protein Lalb_Chr07g0185141 [Lupinus albus]
MFDALSNYLDPTQPSPLLNLDMMWSKNHRSEPNPTYLPTSSSFSPSPHNQEAFLSRDATCSAFLNTTNTTLLNQETGSRGLLSSVSAATNHDQGHNSNMVRNPKKRSRASRRAPTTVLTTDTTNFRAMVQEFTGIPAPPFTSSSSSHFLRTRFDLFAPVHAAKPSTSTLLDPPPYLLRPSAQKVQQPFLPFPPSSSSSMMDTLLLALNNSADPFNNNPNINPSFKNILQQPQQQPSLEIPQPSDGHPKMGVFEELGLRHAHVNNNNNNTNINDLQHQNMVSSGKNNNLMSNTNTSSMDQWAHKTDTANYGKVQHYPSASSSDFHGEKVPETTSTVAAAAAAARSEGMVESWINCSSDN